MMAHTKGPWEFRFDALSPEDAERARKLGMPVPRWITNEGGVIVLGPPDEVSHRPWICEVGSKADVAKNKRRTADDTERDANARLIAQAPVLFELARQSLQLLQDAGDLNCSVLNGWSAEIKHYLAAAIAKAEGRSDA